jgi:hypothetical protein
VASKELLAIHHYSWPASAGNLGARLYAPFKAVFHDQQELKL